MYDWPNLLRLGVPHKMQSFAQGMMLYACVSECECVQVDCKRWDHPPFAITKTWPPSLSIEHHAIIIEIGTEHTAEAATSSQSLWSVQ